MIRQHDGCETDNESIIIEDLSLPQSEKIKGGPTRGGGGNIIVFDIVDS